MASYKDSMSDILESIGDEVPSKLTISGPAKISLKDKSAWSLPAGPEFSCPGATTACENCYATKNRHMFSNVQTAFARNWKILQSYEGKNDIEGMAKIISDGIPKSRKIFRIHESGDFSSQFAINVWTDVVKLRRIIKFWAYTRSFDFNYSQLIRQPNFRLWASTDDYNVASANRFVKRYKNSNVSHAYGPWDHDEDIPDNSFICPATNKTIPLEGACEKCMLCVDSKTKKGVVFLEH